MSVLQKFLKRKPPLDDENHLDELPLDEHDLVNPFEPGLMDKEGVVGESPYLSTANDKASDQNDIVDPELVAAEQKESRFKSLISGIRLPTPGASYNLLAFQAGSFGLRGVLVCDARHGALLGPAAESNNVDFTRAIAEVVDQLKLHHKRLPKQAILVTPSVISSIVELPVSPLRPRSEDEMRELIRWELEGTLTQQNKHWLIGSMLVERGYLTASQRDELVEELQIRQSQGGQEGLLRFGDLAVQLNYITHEQLEECFVLQGKLIAVDDDLAYGWQAEEPQLTQGLSDEALLSKDDDGDSAHKWLVSGMSKSVRRRWVGAFNLNGIKLQAFYPAVGSSFAMLAQRCSDPQQALLEIHQEQLAFITGGPSAVNEIRVEERQYGDVRQDEIQRLLGVLPSDLHKLYVNFQGKEKDEILFALSNSTALDIETLNFEGLDIPKPEHLFNEALLGIAGAAEHFLNHVAKARLSWIPAKDAEVSFFKKLLAPKVLKISAAVAVAFLMMGFLGWMHWNMWQQQERLDQLNTRFETDSKLKQQFSGIAAEQVHLKQKIIEAKEEVALNSKLLILLGKEFPRDKNLINILLKSLILVTPEGVSIQSITQSEGLLMIAALAHRDTQGQEFVSALNKVMVPLDYQVFSSDVSQHENLDESDFAPYQVNITLRQKVSAYISEGQK
ncbi:hypothetical protein ACMXYX_13315 [Neptuniibacter sp. QD72_48]|uniref:hypothetical protein n=1 Tax=unclassified Neptuniibacter TaxID=2630693 RepID=UPI0039F68B0F